MIPVGHFLTRSGASPTREVTEDDIAVSLKAYTYVIENAEVQS